MLRFSPPLLLLFGSLVQTIQLIEQLASPSFEPAKYEDEYRKKVLELIEQKVAGHEIVVAPTQAPKAQIIDLMEALKASLAAKHQPSATAEPRKPTRAKATAAAPRTRAAKAK